MLKQPRYSADGTQCVVAEFSSDDIGKVPLSYVVLVRTQSH